MGYLQAVTTDRFWPFSARGHRQLLAASCSTSQTAFDQKRTFESACEFRGGLIASSVTFSYLRSFKRVAFTDCLQDDCSHLR